MLFLSVQSVIHSSDEEVLVDDFDGQCCRTYPDNHSRIIRWRVMRNEKRLLANAAAQKQAAAAAAAASAAVVTSASPLTGAASPIVPKTTAATRGRDSGPAATSGKKMRVWTPLCLSSFFYSSTWGIISLQHGIYMHVTSREKLFRIRSKNKCLFSASAIPVGIAIGRQRQTSTTSTGAWPPAHLMTSPTGVPPLPPPPPSAGGGSATPMPPSPLHPHHSPWGLPHGHTPSPLGPIPMGYQLAKDPLTGQILLIPTGKGTTYFSEKC